jgi:hypothetical protein
VQAVFVFTAGKVRKARVPLHGRCVPYLKWKSSFVASGQRGACTISRLGSIGAHRTGQPTMPPSHGKAACLSMDTCCARRSGSGLMSLLTDLLHRSGRSRSPPKVDQK